MISLIRQYRASIVADAQHLAQQAPGAPIRPQAVPDLSTVDTDAEPTNVVQLHPRERDMDPASIVGIVVAFGAVFVLIIMEGGSIGEMFLLPPLILIFGGTFGVALAGGLLKDFTGMFMALKSALLTKKSDSDAPESIVKLAERARREGLLALEDGMKDVENEFLRKGLQLAVDGTDEDELQDILEAEVEAKRKVDKLNAKILADMGAYAPTVGIVGTTLGLINALSNLSEPEKLGHLIASAFVATLWGLLSANLMASAVGEGQAHVGAWRSPRWRWSSPAS